MSSKTKIVVLHMKEIIYTVIFAVLAIVLIFLLLFMFRPKEHSSISEKKYIPGVYTSSLTLNNTALEVEVTVDESHINSIRFSNLDESVTTMYPLIQPTIEDIAEQIYDLQSTEGIEYSKDNPYTSQIIIHAIDTALEKAVAD